MRLKSLRDEADEDNAANSLAAEDAGKSTCFRLYTIVEQYLNPYAWTVNLIITYPYAWTVNFEMCLEMQLRTYQPPIPKTSQASAWCYKYIGRWMCKTEGDPTGLGENFGRLDG